MADRTGYQTRCAQVLKLAQLRAKTALTVFRDSARPVAMLGLASREQAQWAREVLSQAQQQLLSPQAPAAANEATDEGPAKPREGAVSSWLRTRLCVQTLRVVVQGYWTPARLRLCLPHLRRFVRGSPRRREHQESTLRSSLLTQLGVSLADSSLLFSAFSP